MKRGVSNLLIVLGIGLAGFGLGSITETRLEESQAQAEWERQTVVAPAPQIKPSIKRRRMKKGALIARLSIKRSKWIVVEGAGKVELRRGPGHVVETAFPGDIGNCVIAGHRDTQFRILRDVQLGENITLESGGRKYVYRVISRGTTAPADNTSLRPSTTPVLTLITCYPFYYVGPAPKRFVVRAELISGGGPQA